MQHLPLQFFVITHVREAEKGVEGVTDVEGGNASVLQHAHDGQEVSSQIRLPCSSCAGDYPPQGCQSLCKDVGLHLFSL